MNKNTKKFFEAEELFDLEQTITRDIFTGIQFSWQVLPKIKDFILELMRNLPADYHETGENIWVGQGATIESTACIKGPAIIGRNTEIRHAAFIRENVIIGDEAVVGNSTEIKNAILFNKVQVPHFNYVGDSVLGYKAHLGGGVILSNLKITSGNVKAEINGQKIDTGMKKFGAIIGDLVEIGTGAILNPGTIIGRESVVYPLTIVRGSIASKSILKHHGVIVRKKGVEGTR